MVDIEKSYSDDSSAPPSAPTCPSPKPVSSEPALFQLPLHHHAAAPAPPPPPAPAVALASVDHPSPAPSPIDKHNDDLLPSNDSSIIHTKPDDATKATAKPLAGEMSDHASSQHVPEEDASKVSSYDDIAAAAAAMAAVFGDEAIGKDDQASADKPSNSQLHATPSTPTQSASTTDNQERFQALLRSFQNTYASFDAFQVEFRSALLSVANGEPFSSSAEPILQNLQMALAIFKSIETFIETRAFPNSAPPASSSSSSQLGTMLSSGMSSLFSPLNAKRTASEKQKKRRNGHEKVAAVEGSSAASGYRWTSVETPGKLHNKYGGAVTTMLATSAESISPATAYASAPSSFGGYFRPTNTQEELENQPPLTPEGSAPTTIGLLPEDTFVTASSSKHRRSSSKASRPRESSTTSDRGSISSVGSSGSIATSPSQLPNTTTSPTTSQQATSNDTVHTPPSSSSSSGIPTSLGSASRKAAATAADAREIPQYRMNRKISTLQEMVREWYEGLDGGPSVRSLEAQYGSKWRTKNDAERVFLGRRKVIINRIEQSIRASTGKRTVDQIVEEMETERKRLKKSIDGLGRYYSQISAKDRHVTAANQDRATAAAVAAAVAAATTHQQAMIHAAAAAAASQQQEAGGNGSLVGPNGGNSTSDSSNSSSNHTNGPNTAPPTVSAAAAAANTSLQNLLSSAGDLAANQVHLIPGFTGEVGEGAITAVAAAAAAAAAAAVHAATTNSSAGVSSSSPAPSLSLRSESDAGLPIDPALAQSLTSTELSAAQSPDKEAKKTGPVPPPPPSQQQPFQTPPARPQYEYESVLDFSGSDKKQGKSRSRHNSTTKAAAAAAAAAVTDIALAAGATDDGSTNQFAQHEPSPAKEREPQMTAAAHEALVATAAASTVDMDAAPSEVSAREAASVASQEQVSVAAAELDEHLAQVAAASSAHGLEISGAGGADSGDGAHQQEAHEQAVYVAAAATAEEQASGAGPMPGEAPHAPDENDEVVLEFPQQGTSATYQASDDNSMIDHALRQNGRQHDSPEHNDDDEGLAQDEEPNVKLEHLGQEDAS